MKGIVLAGGTGSRLHPLTAVTNKHLLPGYNRPMVYFPVEKLIEAGIGDIMIVTGGNDAGRFLRLLSNGKDLGLEHIEYAYQEVAGGIPDALRLCRHFAGDENVCVILGDNIFEGSLREAVDSFETQGRGARILLTDSADSGNFPTATFENDAIVSIHDKPLEKNSDSAQGAALTGVFFFDNSLFDKINTLKPSWRGELEINDAIRLYLEEGTLAFSMLAGWWVAAGTFNSLLEANRRVAQLFGNGANPTSSP